MKKSLIALFAAAVAFAGLGLAPADAEARRLGGGGSFGMQRSAPAPTKQAVPPKPATPAQATNPAAATAPAAAAQAGKRSWLGPIAGLAAGLGIAALLSHLGLGEEVASFLMIALLVFAAIFVVRLLFRKRPPQAAMQYAGSHSGRVEPLRFEAAGGTTPAKVGAGETAAGSSAAPVPADFDVEGFLRQAKLNFLRLQAANDRGAMDDVKSFTTPEVFAEIQMQFEERGRAAQQTDVAQLDADLLAVVSEGDRHIASVRFHGRLTEEVGAPHAVFDEVWHLTKPLDGSRGWMIAGIQQSA